MEVEVMIGSPVVERPVCAGKDAFGVAWNLEEAWAREPAKRPPG